MAHGHLSAEGSPASRRGTNEEVVQPVQLIWEYLAQVTTYKMMKKIYDVRSKVVHGALHTFKKTEELLSIVQTADAICRRVMLYAFTTADEDNIFIMENDRLDDYFLRLVLK